MMLSRRYAPTPVAMLSLFYDASAVVQPCSSSRRTPDPLLASRFRNRFPPRLLTGMTSRRFGLPACTANPEDLPPSLAQHGSPKRPSTSPRFSFEDTRAGRRSPGAVKPKPLAEPPPRTPSTTLFSITPALNHFLIKRRTRLSAIRCSTNRSSQRWSRLEKWSRKFASSTQFTRLRVIPVASAPNASCGERPGRNPIRKPHEVRLVDRVQTPRPPPAAGSCPQAQRSRVAAAAHRASVCTPSTTASPGNSRDERERADPKGSLTSRSNPYSRHVTPSTPGAAFGRIARYAARRRSTST